MCVNRVVVFSVLLVNAHTWGLNSSYAVFLAYYLRSGTIEGSSALGFAFVGGLSISICQPPPFGDYSKNWVITNSSPSSSSSISNCDMVHWPVWDRRYLANWRRIRGVSVPQRELEP
jgi:hypothetical protein